MYVLFYIIVLICSIGDVKLIFKKGMYVMKVELITMYLCMYIHICDT